ARPRRRGRRRRRADLERRRGEGRGSHLEHLAAREPLLRINTVGVGGPATAGARWAAGAGPLAPTARCVAHRFPFLNSPARYSQERHASAMMVHVGFWHDALT